MSKLTAAYIAGLLDGEGYFGIIKRSYSKTSRKTTGNYYLSVVKMANTDKAIIEWLQKSFGGWVHKREFSGNSKDAYCWTLANGNLVPFVSKIMPYLKIKKIQAELILKRENLKERLANLGERKGTVYGGKDLEILRGYYLNIRKLNHRGKALHVKRLSEETPKGDATV